MSSDDWFRRDHHILYLSIQLQARAGEDAVVGVRNGRLLLRIKAPPVDGKANHRLLEFLADRLGVPRSRLKIVRGEHSRYKLVAVSEGGAVIDPRDSLLKAPG